MSVVFIALGICPLKPDPLVIEEAFGAANGTTCFPKLTQAPKLGIIRLRRFVSERSLMASRVVSTFTRRPV